MKKCLSLFLALAMVLSLGITAFAGNAAASVLRLTGDAAAQVVEPQNGESLSADSSTLLRLNVLQDPVAEEYAVTLNGTPLTADHSTSQYHFYSLPAALTSTAAVTNLSVNSESTSAPTITVTVGGVSKTVTLPADGSTTASTSAATQVTVELDNTGTDAMERIYFSEANGVTYGTGISSSKIFGELVRLDAGYTGNNLYFYKDPKGQTRTVYAAWSDGGTTRYYKITVNRGAQSGLALGPNGSGYKEETPGGLSSLDQTAWLLNGMVRFGTMMVYDGLKLYADGKASGSNIIPAWDELTAENNGLYYTKANGSSVNAYFARPGFYWLPVSTQSGEDSVDGFLPIEARWNNYSGTKAYLTYAEGVKNDVSGLPEAAANMFDTAYNAVKTMNDANNLGKFLYLNDDGSYPTELTKTSGISARTYFGAPLYGVYLVEEELETLLDLTDIFTTWSTNAELAGQQFEAYQRILNMNGGIHSIMQVSSTGDRDLYQTIRQAKWDLIHTSDLAGVNTVLTSLGLESIEPVVLLGDINGDGEIDLRDAALLIRHCNEAVALTEVQCKAADLNGDGKVDIKDAGLIIRYCNEAITEFPAKKS